MTRPGLRVALVSEHASPLAVLGGEDAGGQNVHVAALACALADGGASVVVHTRRDDPDLPRRVLLRPGVEVDHVDAGPPAAVAKDELLPYMGPFADDLRRAWRRDRPDVVHAHFWMSGLAAVHAAAALPAPVLLTFHALGAVKRRHQGDKDTSPPARLAAERRLLGQVDRIVATCSDEVFELVRLGADPADVSVVPCGVDLGLFGPGGPVAPRRPGLHRVLMVGRLVERTGVADAVAGVAQVPGTELVVAGGPARPDLDGDPEVRRLRAAAAAAGVADRVRFLGRVGRGDLPAWYRSADVVVCVPWYEPFGIVPLEAMACGVPVVAANVGGLVDTVVDGVTGVHVPARDPAALASALRRLLADPWRRHRLGRAGVHRARTRYGWDRVAAATRRVYERQLLAGSPPARTVRR